MLLKNMQKKKIRCKARIKYGFQRVFEVWVPSKSGLNSPVGLICFWPFQGGTHHVNCYLVYVMPHYGTQYYSPTYIMELNLLDQTDFLYSRLHLHVHCVFEFLSVLDTAGRQSLCWAIKKYQKLNITGPK